MWFIPFSVAVLSLMLVMRVRKKRVFTQEQPRESEKDTSKDIFTDAMNPKIAREVLGIDDEANKREIIAAHRRLMRHIHPDRGGSAYLASQINQAKEVLIKSARRQRG